MTNSNRTFEELSVPLINEKEAAGYLSVSIRALQQWRHRREGPRWVMVGRCVRYRPCDLREFVEANLRPEQHSQEEGAP